MKNCEDFSVFSLELMWWTPFSGKLDQFAREAEATIELESYFVPSAPLSPEIGWEKQ